MFKFLVIIIWVTSGFIAYRHEGQWSRKKQLAVLFVPMVILLAFTMLLEA